MGMAPTEKVVLGSIAFAVFWALAVSKKVPFLPIGRTSGSLLGAVLMVIFQVITPEQAYSAIDLPILSFLFGTMLLTAYLERADMFKYLGKLLSWKSKGAKDLLCRICLISAISSAFFTNDTSCVVLTEFILKIAREKNLPPHPFLLALVSSANIGSTATPIGNPQNLVIATQSKISFGRFLFGILPAMLVGVFVNVLLLISMYWKLLKLHKDEENEDVENRSSSPNVNGNTVHVDETNGEFESEMDTNEVRNDEFSHTRDRTVVLIELSPMNGISTDGIGNPLPCLDEKENFKWKRVLWKSCVYLITIGMLICLLMGLNMSWTAITSALALVILDFQDAGPSLTKVSYTLLIFFCGMFITVDGFNKTGIPTALWEFMEPYAQINHIGGIAVFAIVILLLSNVVSNVPTVLLLGGKVAASAAAISTTEEKKAWLVLAWVSTVAGNLSLLGSAANLIVCEKALSSPHLSYNLSFWTHFKFGFPSTLIVTAIGLALIK